MNSSRFIGALRPALGLLLALAAGCHFDPPIKGSGVSKTETRTVAGFTEVEVSGTVHLELTVGPAASLEVTTDDNILPIVVTEVSGGRLKISMRGNSTTSLGVNVKATTPTLSAFEGSGATSSTLSGIRAGLWTDAQWSKQLHPDGRNRTVHPQLLRSVPRHCHGIGGANRAGNGQRCINGRGPNLGGIDGGRFRRVHHSLHGQSLEIEDRCQRGVEGREEVRIAQRRVRRDP